MAFGGGGGLQVYFFRIQLISVQSTSTEARHKQHVGLVPQSRGEFYPCWSEILFAQFTSENDNLPSCQWQAPTWRPSWDAAVSPHPQQNRLCNWTLAWPFYWGLLLWMCHGKTLTDFTGNRISPTARVRGEENKIHLALPCVHVCVSKVHRWDIETHRERTKVPFLHNNFADNTQNIHSVSSNIHWHFVRYCSLGKTVTTSLYHLNKTFLYLLFKIYVKIERINNNKTRHITLKPIT